MAEILIDINKIIANKSEVNRRYLDRFNFLQDNLLGEKSLHELVDFYQLLKYKTPSGPLRSNVDQIMEMVVVELFCHTGLSVKEISAEFNYKKSFTAQILYNFFRKVDFGNKDFEKIFLIDDLANEFEELDFLQFSKESNLKFDHDQLRNYYTDLPLNRILESPGWERVLINKSVKPQENSVTFSKEKLWRLFILYLALIILLASTLFIFLQVNKFNEQDLLSKIKVPSRFFTWLELESFTNVNLNTGEGRQVSLNTENFTGGFSETFQVEEDRFDVESDVVLSSLEQINETGGQGLESDGAKGFRDTRYGRNTVYRIMVNSADVVETSKKIKTILKTFDVQKGGNVEPGAKLPGGLYYNLLVDSTQVKSFLGSLGKNVELSIYLSKSRMLAPEGMSNVFLWVKKI